MKKRILAMLMVLAMTLSLLPPITVAAETFDYAAAISAANAMTFPTDKVSTKEADCPACGAEAAVWSPLTQEMVDATTSHTFTGHYYLAESITSASGSGTLYMNGTTGTLCLHLNGQTLANTGNMPAIRMWSGNYHLNIMGSGTVTSNSGNWGSLSAQGGNCNVFGGTYANTGSNYKGAITCRSKTVNIYDATIETGTLRVAEYSDTTWPEAVNVYGGNIAAVNVVNVNDTVTIKGGTIGTVNAGGNVTVEGGTVQTLSGSGIVDTKAVAGAVTVTGGTVNKLVGTADTTGITISGNPVINALDLAECPVLLTVGTLTNGAKINLGDRTGVFTNAFASKEAAEAAAAYFTVTSDESILVTEDNCLTTGRDGYLVGYSKVDINPYADGTGADQALMSIGMAGYGDNDTRLSLEDKLDDNGDGKVDANDGIFATCTAITDKYGNTALLFTADMLWGYNANYCDYVVQTLLEDESYASYGLSEDRIFFNGAHNHFAPQTGADTDSDAQAAFNEIMRTQLLKAAQEALADRAWADMYEGSLNVKDYFNTGSNKQQAVGDLLNEMRQAAGSDTIDEATYESRVGDKDVFFTASRHFKMTEQKILTNADGTPMVDTDGSPYKYVLDSEAQPVTYYAGNGFNGDWKGVNTLHYVYAYDEATGEITDEVKEIRVVTAWEEVVEADDTLRVVQFRFSSDSGKEPVVMINWRGHLPSSANLSDTSYQQVSGGMVNALRSAMAFKGYRASFLQGETGGINMSFLGTEGSWATTVAEQKTNIFGTELAQLALTVIDDAQKINEDGGQIQATRQVYQTDYVHSTPFEYMAAMRYKTAYYANDKVSIGKRIYTGLSYYVDADGDPLIDTSGQTYTTNADGETVAVGDPVTMSSAEAITISSWDEADRKDRSYQYRETHAEYFNDVALYAMTIGEDFKLVSVAAEIFDHYGDEGTNLWDALKADHNDPFILGLTNTPGGGYMPDKTNYGLAASDGEPTYVVGTYESNSTRYAQGTGEAVVEQLDIMLDFLESEHDAGATTEGQCAHCGETVTWTDLSQAVTDGALRFENQFASGHYYLPEGKTATLTYKNIPADADVCIDLNGQTLNIARGLTVNGKLSIVDSQGTGTVIGTEGPREGGIFYVSGELNIYGGTYRYVATTQRPVASGGIVYVAGTFTLYDGTLEGATTSLMGGTMVVGKTGKAFFRGGDVLAGTSGAGNGNCVTATGEVTLAGDASISSVFFINGSTNYETQRLHIDGVYTGTVNASGMVMETVIGDAINGADTSLASITQWQGYTVHIEDGKVVMRMKTDYVAQNSETGEFIYGDYEDLNTALASLPDDSRVVMLEKIDTSLSFSISSNITWELKGQALNNTITVAEGKTLQIVDCKGTGSINGDKIIGSYVFGDETDSGVVYIPIEDEEGNSTYHPVRLNIDQLVLRADNADENGKAAPGLYFKHRFDGDETVKGLVESYGIAFSLVDDGSFETALKAEGALVYEDSVVYRSGNVVYTKLDEGFGTAEAANTSTLITGIMKEENGVSTNRNNAQMPIYGVAYIKLTTGEVVLGQIRQRSLQEQIEGIDTQWDSLTHAQRKGVLKMYKVPTITSVVDGWEVSNLTDPAKAQSEDEQKILRVLSIGNSHTDNATEYLYNIFQAENPDQEVQIAQLYYSGCSVAQHVEFMAKDAAVYRYRTQDNRNPSGYSTMKQALQAEIWDVVILHEMNNSAGAESTYTGANSRNLQKHINNVKKYGLNSDPKLIWNFSWANPSSEYLWGLGYPAGDNYSWVDSYKQNYGSDYDYMLSCMITQTKKYVMTNSAFADVAPTGLAFKYARDYNPDQTDPDVLLYCDYTHAGPGFGRLLVSYVWYATLTGQTEITELKYPRDLTEDQQELLIAAVNYALDNKESLRPE